MFQGPLKSINNALLGKWLWRIGHDSEGLWRQVLLAKYPVERDGWDIHTAVSRQSAFWKGICSVKDDFMRNIRFKVGKGDSISFWRDTYRQVIVL